MTGYAPAVPTVSFQSATFPELESSSTSLTLTGPTGVTDSEGEGLYAFVLARSAITEPSGWSLVVSQSAAYTGFTQYLECFVKDSVSSADSGGMWSWTQASSGRFEGWIAHVRSDMGSPRVIKTQTASFSLTSQGQDVPISALNTERGNELSLFGTSTVLSSGAWTYTPPTDYTTWITGSFSSRVKGGYQEHGAAVESTATAVDVAVTNHASNSGGVAMVTITGSQWEEFLQDSAGHSSTFDLMGSTYNPILTDGVDLSSMQILGGEFVDALATDLVSIAQTLTGDISIGALVSETIGVNHEGPFTLPATSNLTPAYQFRAGGLISETVGTALTQLQAVGVRLAEGVETTITLDPKMTFNQSLTTALATAANVKAGVGVSIADVAQMAFTLQTAQVVKVLEDLGLTPAFALKTTYNLVETQTIGLNDALRAYFSGVVSDTVGTSSTPLASYHARSVISETIGASETLAPTLILRAVLAEGVDITPSEALKMTYNSTLADGVDLTAAYLSPGDSFTTWAINTKVGAVTEYSNYEFNSFAQLERKYLGATSSGLYELNGLDDDGTNIVAHLKSGFLQFAGSHFTTFKAAYLGVRGAGDFVFRILTGDGKTYNYAVTAKSMETTKIHLGKGLRARYFAFELISTGQDFDLDSIEFVPLATKRRV